MIEYTITQYEFDVEKILERIKNINIKAVYGVPRGGQLLSSAIAYSSNILLVSSPEGFLKDEILIVDDIVDSGRTRNKYKEYPYFISLVTRKEHADKVWYSPNIVEKEEWIHFWWEKKEEIDIEETIIRQLEYIGENPNREGLLKTPQRIIKSWEELFGGYKQDPKEIFTVFQDTENYTGLVLLKDIEFHSFCEHHMQVFSGKAHIAYIPNGKVIGVSKLARLLDIYARRMQIQERIGQQVTNDLMKYLNPLGAACVIEAQHNCMKARGVKKQNSAMVTSSLTGVFLDEFKVRQELMSLIK